MTSPTLYKATRVCVVCADEAPGQRGVCVASGANMLTITPLLYRRGVGKGRLKNAPGVYCCEPCFVKATTAGRLGWVTGGTAKLWAALQESLSGRYNAMLRDDL